MRAGNRKALFLYEGHVGDEWICNELRMVKKRSTHWARAAVRAGDELGRRYARAEVSSCKPLWAAMKKTSPENEPKRVFLIEREEER